MLNRFDFCGYVHKDPFYSETKTKKPMCKFTVAIPQDYTDAQKRRKSDFVEFCAFGPTANYVTKWIKKGDLISGTARLYNNNYVDKNGNKVYKTSCKIELIYKLMDVEKMKKNPKTTITTMEGEELPDFEDFDIGELPDDMYCPFE